MKTAVGNQQMKRGETVTGGKTSLKTEHYKNQENISEKQTETKDTVLTSKWIIEMLLSFLKALFYCSSVSQWQSDVERVRIWIDVIFIIFWFVLNSNCSLSTILLNVCLSSQYVRLASLVQCDVVVQLFQCCAMKFKVGDSLCQIGIRLLF